MIWHVWLAWLLCSHPAAVQLPLQAFKRMFASHACDYGGSRLHRHERVMHPEMLSMPVGCVQDGCAGFDRAADVAARIRVCATLWQLP